MNKKNTKGLMIALKAFDWFLIIYLAARAFIPKIFGSTIYFFQSFMGVYFVVYSIINTAILALASVGIIVIIITAYTKKLDEIKTDTPDFVPIWKTILSIIKCAIIVYLTSIFNLNYITVICSLIIIYDIIYCSVQRDYLSKITKLNLLLK